MGDALRGIEIWRHYCDMWDSAILGGRSAVALWMLPMCKCCQFQFSITNKGGVTNWQLTALVLATLPHWQHSTGTPYHTPPKRRHKANTKRCVAEYIWLRTFSSFPAQGLGEWCAGLIWRRKECVQETDLCLTFWRRLDIITAVLYNKCGVNEFWRVSWTA